MFGVTELHKFDDVKKDSLVRNYFQNVIPGYWNEYYFKNQNKSGLLPYLIAMFMLKIFS